MPGDPAPPVVPEDDLAATGWELVEESVETMAQLPAMQVRGTTLEYDDLRMRSALEAATDGELSHRIRFFAATRLGFRPQLPVGVTAAMVGTQIRSAATDKFIDRLESHGLTDIDRQDSTRLRVNNGKRARLKRFRAIDPFEGTEATLPLDCLIAIWTDRKEAMILTAGYPAVSVSERTGLEDADDVLSTPSETLREEVISLLKAVE